MRSKINFKVELVILSFILLSTVEVLSFDKKCYDLWIAQCRIAKDNSKNTSIRGREADYDECTDNASKACSGDSSVSKVPSAGTDKKTKIPKPKPPAAAPSGQAAAATDSNALAGLNYCDDANLCRYSNNFGRPEVQCIAKEKGKEGVRSVSCANATPPGGGQTQQQNKVEPPRPFTPDIPSIVDNKIADFKKDCEAASASILKECSDAFDQADNHCDPKKSPEASDGADAITQMGQSLSAMASQGRDGQGVLLACKGIMQAVAAVNATYQAMQTKCTGYRDNCLKLCSSSPSKIRKNCEQREGAAREDAKAELIKQYEGYKEQFTPDVRNAGFNPEPIDRHIQALNREFVNKVRPAYDQITEGEGRPDGNKATCKDMETHIKDAQVAMNSLAQTGQAATMCGNQVSNLATPDFCKDNPRAPGCEGAMGSDCSNPQVAMTDKVCICRNDPTNAACGSGDGSLALKGLNGAGAGIGTGAAETSSSGKGSGVSGLLGSALDAMENVFGKPAASGGEGESVGGSKGGKGADGAGISGGGGGAGGGGGQAADESNKANILNGYRSGFSGGGGYGGSNYGSGSSEYNPSSFNNPTGGTVAGGGPDLRQFLPGGEMDPKNRRGLAGVVGPDGITGPHSDLWQNVNRRYQTVESSLLP